MANAPYLSPEDAVRWTEEKLLEGGTPPNVPTSWGIRAHTLAAREHGIPDTTFRNSLNASARKGVHPDWSLYRPNDRAKAIEAARKGLKGFEPVLDGFEIKSTTSVLDDAGNVVRTFIKQVPEAGDQYAPQEGQTLKGISALVGGDGRVLQQWIKTRTSEDPIQITKEIKSHFENWTPNFAPAAIPSPDLKFDDSLALYPWSDPHFGLRVWAGDASENWDLKIAVRKFKETFTRVISGTPTAKKAIFLVGGDTLHANNNNNTTARSLNPVQVDGRHPKVFLTACETIVEIAQMMLEKHEEIEIINLLGNHDEDNADPISFFLHAWFRNESRIKVDISSHMFRFRKYGKVMLGFTHGHTARAKDMHTIMSHYEPKMWGDTEYRFAHTFHIHHKSKYISENGGCVTESHQIIAPADAWHYAQGYKAGRSQQSIIYEKDRGEIGRTCVSI